MGDGELASIPSGARDQIARLREVVGHGLVTDDVEAGIQRCRRKRVVRVVGRHDGDRVDAVRPQLFLRQHLRHVAVAALGGEPHRGAGDAGASRIAGEHAGHRAPPAVHLGRAAMHAADPRVRAATDDPQPQGPAETFLQTRHVLPPEMASRRLGDREG